jgi:cytochrome c biogenesis protein CcmG/thiol:disulfide interchange protein DsbE
MLLGSIALLGAALVWVVSGTLEQRVVNAGDKAPNFHLTTDRGRNVTVDNFGGKLLVLNFWATWCPPCVEETPSLEEFAREMGPEGVVVLGVSVDRNQDLYRKFLERYKIPFETVRDPEANVPASYGTFQYPETYIIDRSGRVVEKIISNVNWMDPQFVAHVRAML